MRLLVLRVLLAASTFLACASACSSLKRADDAPDGGASAVDDSGTPFGFDSGTPPPGSEDSGALDGAVADSAPPDAGPPPADFACASDAWTKAVKTKAECAPRQVKVVTALAPIDPTGVSIARTSAGRVGIVFNDEVDSTAGEMHLFHFTPTTATYAAPKLATPASGFAYHYGYRTKISAIAPDTLAVLAFDMDDATGPPRTGEVHLRKLVAGAEPLTDDLVTSGVADPTEIAVASEPGGTTYATVRVAIDGTTSKLIARMKAPTGPFTALPDLTATLLTPTPLTPVPAPPKAPGIGAASLLVDPGGQLHLLYHRNEFPLHSAPRYHTLGGTTWSSPKTIDNAVPDGLSGYSPRLAVFGAKKYAAFYFRKGGQSNPITADLRLATWSAAADVPVIEILAQGIPSPTADTPTYRVAMAVDKFGLVHLAILRPTSATAGYLEYRRQIPDGAGGTTWLSDIVDPDCMSDQSESFVDMVVDENARPHIAYRAGKGGLVNYATRFDR